MTKDEKSLLLFFEACMTDHVCQVNIQHMNDTNKGIAETWRKDDFIQYGRRKFSEITNGNTHWVILNNEALDAALALRKERALRSAERLVAR